MWGKKMNLTKLKEMNDIEMASWVRKNVDTFELIQTSELENIIEERDCWESKATELATDVGALLGMLIQPMIFSFPYISVG
jgi:hypothetical protein